MPDEIKKKEEDKMCFFDYLTEIVGWLQIVASPLLFGLLIAAYIYFSNPTTLRLIIAIGVALLGLIAGIILATRIWKKQGTMNFVSRISATPELDNLEEEEK
jgi:hypothetical protein